MRPSARSSRCVHSFLGLPLAGTGEGSISPSDGGLRLLTDAAQTRPKPADGHTELTWTV
jgi:hypothetical protein